MARMHKIPLHYQTITHLAQGLRSGIITCTRLMEHFLARSALLDKKLHAFHVVCAEDAMAHAHSADLALKAGKDLGNLHGIPYAAKDLFDVKGLPTAAGTACLKKMGCGDCG